MPTNCCTRPNGKAGRAPEHSLSCAAGNDHWAFHPAKAGQVMANKNNLYGSRDALKMNKENIRPFGFTSSAFGV